MKKFVSLILSLVVVLSVTTPAFAAQPQLTTEEVGFICEDLSNGDAVFYYEIGSNRLYETYVSRATNKVIYTDYTSMETSTLNYTPSAMPILPHNASLSYTYAGSVSYDYYSTYSDEPQGSRTLEFSYDQTTDIHDSYNVRGTWQNATTLAGILCGVFALPSAIAGELVAEIASYLGLGLAIGSPLIIPDLYVDCISIAVTWKFQDQNVPAFLEYMTGTRYDFMYDDQAHTEYDGFYYPVISFRNRDYDFAYRAYACVYGPGRCSITDWS